MSKTTPNPSATVTVPSFFSDGLGNDVRPSAVLRARRERGEPLAEIVDDARHNLALIAEVSDQLVDEAKALLELYEQGQADVARIGQLGDCLGTPETPVAAQRHGARASLKGTPS